MIYPIVEIFSSIQGEGKFMGIPATFIRLSGCNLKCSFCDTDHSISIPMNIEDIVSKVRYAMVIITGGEPTLHNLTPLLTALKETVPDCFICLETNGTLFESKGENLIDHITCSPKEASSYYINPELCVDEIKLVVTKCFTQETLKTAISTILKGTSIWLQPESSDMQGNLKRAYLLAMNYEGPHLVRVGIQMHKIIDVQ